MAPRFSRTRTSTAKAPTIAYPWGTQSAMNALVDRIGSARYVFLGEASHGTHEYYLWRARISQRLLAEQDFSFIAVEGDWPECYQLNRYIKHYEDSGSSASDVLHAFNRWPTWMWANQEIMELAEWMRKHNAGFKLPRQVGFYGLDVYSLWESMGAVIDYLREVDPTAAKQAEQAYLCFEPYGQAAEAYASRTAFVPKSCEADVLKVLHLLKQRHAEHPKDDEASFDAEQNARIAVNAEQYYRTMMRGDAASWNIRDQHMLETLEHLMQRNGPDAKAIIWAHNTHVGDARYTTMADNGMVNLGQLAREAWGEDNVVLIGFGSHHGSVIAGQSWNAPMQLMSMPPAQPDSWEALLHDLPGTPTDKLLMSNDLWDHRKFQDMLGHRAIGVVYDPDDEQGNYVPTHLSDRYDAFIYIDGTKALRPLHFTGVLSDDYPETFPWGY